MNKYNKPFWFTWISVLLLSVAALLLLYLGYIDYGIAVFCVLPICIGILTGIMGKKRKAILGMIAAIATIVFLLWAGQLEGLVCIVMAIPVVAFFILLGYIIAFIIKKLSKKDDALKLTVIPFLLFFLSAGIEIAWKGTEAFSHVTTSIQLPYPGDTVYNHIKQVDTVTASPSFIHQLGLPYPRKCIMITEQPGGLRICEFDEGRIIEKISRLKKNELLEMDVIEYGLPGQSWFTFEKDTYAIKETNGLTTISRTTIYSSKLKPRLYWKWIEKITIGAEQALVFKNLKNELAATAY